MLGADGGFEEAGVGAALSAGALTAGCSEVEEPVSEPHQRLTRLPLDAPAPVSALAVVVHWPELLAVRAGCSTAGAAAACSLDPGVTDVEKAAIEAAPSAEPPPSAIN